jgi:tetratricopeptide (TPR) repeat protein
MQAPHEILERLAAPPRSAEDAADAPQAGERVLIEDFRPLAGCLEWALAEAYWEARGLRPFVEDAVPHLVHNSGWAAEDAGAVLFESCRRLPPGDSPIRVQELGAGAGLFARLLLDVLRRLCAEHGASYYDRLELHVTDRSSSTVAQWAELGLFDDHAGRVVPATCDALDPGWTTAGSRRDRQLPRMHAVFANYVLDSLPMAVVRRAGERTEQLCVRSWLARRHEPELRARTGLSCDDVVRLSRDRREHRRLLPAVTLLEFEAAFRPDGASDVAHLEAALDEPGPERVIVSHGAIRCIESCLERLEPGGFLWVNDIGIADRRRMDGAISVLRYEASVAANLNLALLARRARERGYQIVEPAGDESRLIHSRLFARELPPEVARAFRARLERGSGVEPDRLATTATEHIVAGRWDDALDCYRRGLERYPEDWHLLGQAAQFLTQQLLRHEEAHELASRAVARNPWLSSFLWNTLGNCRFCLGRVEDAHQAYQRAREIDASDPQTWLNLAYTLARLGDHEAALEATARGLFHDADGRFETALLDKQREILGRLRTERTERDERNRRRDEALRSCR